MLAVTWLPLQAQENPTPELSPIPFIHTVQEGENLTFIATNFGLTIEELQAANNLTPDDLLFVGQELIIPGREGSEVAAFYTIQAGDTLAGIAAQFNTTVTAVAQSNNLITPNPALVVGDILAVTSRTGSAAPRPVTGTPHVVAANEGWLSIAARYRLTPAQLATNNQQLTTDYLLPGQRLRIPSQTKYRDLPGEWIDMQIRPLPIIQGFTTSIYVANLLDGLPSGQFAGQPLRFTPYENGYVALVGLDAFAATGLQTLELMGSGSRPWTPFRQNLRVQSGGYGQQLITIPDEISYLLAPEIRASEDAILGTIYSQFSETQQWEGLFTLPVTNTIVTAGYGDSRSYNGGPFEIFHTGVDVGGGIGTPILAPANGTVVFTDTMELHGNIVVIDHGLGVMSAYFHLSEFFVKVGDVVTAGQPVGAGGNTGLSSGPHLHWELRVNNVAVDGRQWTQIPFP
ncbi:MAG: LysM peptidoglycan-binding domain-containing protein [Ardenticatenaceae bacterium]|nr:LysM peptidoglycan-binding domain-containing protein [Ardenticatenaceae bacterium]